MPTIADALARYPQLTEGQVRRVLDRYEIVEQEGCYTTKFIRDKSTGEKEKFVSWNPYMLDRTIELRLFELALTEGGSDERSDEAPNGDTEQGGGRESGGPQTA